MTRVLNLGWFLTMFSKMWFEAKQYKQSIQPLQCHVERREASYSGKGPAMLKSSLATIHDSPFTIKTSVISREFRQVLAWLNDERSFSSYYKRYSPADEEKDCLSRWRSCVMVVYGLKDYFSSLSLPRNDMGFELGAGSLLAALPRNDMGFNWLLMRKLRNINNNSALAERTLPSPLMGLRGKRDTFGYPALAHWATSHGPLTGSEKMTRVLNLGVVFDYV